MKYDETLIDDWLAGRNPQQDEISQDVWDPGFEAERQVVFARLGPYNRLYKKPENFVRRFYHRVYPLTIGNLNLSFKTELYGGFCTIDSHVDIRYQPTVRYAQDNRDVLENIHQHIKNVYTGLVRDLVEKELLALDDGEWVNTGLAPVERKTAEAINEALMLQNIHCRTMCSLVPVFSELPETSNLDAGFIQESIYLNVMRKNFEFREKQKLEMLRQQEEQERLELERQRIEQEQAIMEDQVFRDKQALEAEQKKKQLEEKEQQMSEQFQVEERIQAKKTQHEMRIKEIQAKLEMQAQEKLHALEEQMKAKDLQHKHALKEHEQQEEIDELDKLQKQWLESKERLHLKKIQQEQYLEQLSREAELKNKEEQQIEQQKLQERLFAEKLKHESRLKEMELEMEVKDHEKRFETSQKTSEYLRREIELLVLEKQRIELDRAVKNPERLVALESDH